MSYVNKKGHARIQMGGAGGLTPPESYQANIQCWAIIGRPAKHHLNDVSLEMLILVVI